MMAESYQTFLQSIQGKPITIYGNGLANTITFCYVDDMVDAVMRLMNSDLILLPRPMNLGNPVEYSMLD